MWLFLRCGNQKIATGPSFFQYPRFSGVLPKIEGLLEKCTKDLENWRVLANNSEVIISVSAHLKNWNRELKLSPRTLQLLSDRKIALNIDVYFWVEDESPTPKDG